MGGVGGLFQALMAFFKPIYFPGLWPFPGPGLPSVANFMGLDKARFRFSVGLGLRKARGRPENGNRPWDGRTDGCTDGRRDETGQIW